MTRPFPFEELPLPHPATLPHTQQPSPAPHAPPSKPLSIRTHTARALEPTSPSPEILPPGRIFPPSSPPQGLTSRLPASRVSSNAPPVGSKIRPVGANPKPAVPVHLRTSPDHSASIAGSSQRMPHTPPRFRTPAPLRIHAPSARTRNANRSPPRPLASRTPPAPAAPRMYDAATATGRSTGPSTSVPASGVRPRARAKSIDTVHHVRSRTRRLSSLAQRTGALPGSPIPSHPVPSHRLERAIPHSRLTYLARRPRALRLSRCP
ncbi:hypothetical protein CERSUDRAFT_100737 [Gelatoporia subvermispora B]|uniref:Uncharacterized protein n=1 Tax=Ceriporiopsis subvermispora (strain B) TaxID=914234 RepID=M2P6Z1_CERS8|nr:hypothetical protein CERSUDRAFT_100737 [Gelatoporia subvermispora B]